MNPEELQKWFDNFLNVLRANEINPDDGIDSLRLVVYENTSADPKNPHYEVKDAIDHKELSEDAKQFLQGRKKYSELENGPESIFDIEHLLSRRKISEITDKEKELLYNKVKNGEVCILPKDFCYEKMRCIYSGDPTENEAEPIYVSSLDKEIKAIGIEEEEEITAYFNDANYEFESEELAAFVKKEKENGVTSKEDVIDHLVSTRKHAVIPGRQSLDVADKYYGMISSQLGNMMAAQSEDFEESERLEFMAGIQMGINYWKVNVLSDYRQHPEYYATKELRRERNEDHYLSELGASIQSNTIELFTDDEWNNFKSHSKNNNSASILKLENILGTVVKQIYPDGVSPEMVKDLQNEHPVYNDIDYLIQSGKIVSAGHVYQPGSKPWDARNEIVRDILSGKEISIISNVKKNEKPLCYSISVSDDLEPKLMRGTSALMKEDDMAAAKQGLINLQKRLADIGDSSGDSAEYKEMKQGIQNAIDRFDNICTEGGYKRLMSDLSDCAAKYYIAKVDQPMNSRRSKRFQLAEALYLFPEKQNDRTELYKNRIAAKLAAANLHELTKRSDWMAGRAKLLLGSKDRFNKIVDLVKMAPDFQALVDNKSEKQLAAIFTSSASRLLSAAAITGKAIVHNLRADHIKEKVVDRTYKNSEAAIKGLQQFTNKLERLSGPKDAKLFTEMKEQLDETLMNLKYTTDEQAALDNINALREKSMKYFTEKISEGMTKTRPDRIRAAMSIVNSIDRILGKKENTLLAPASERETRKIMLAARLSKQTLTMALKKGPDAELADKILNNPDLFMKNVSETFESAAFQGFVNGKTDAQLDKMLSMSPSDLCKKSMKDTLKPQKQIQLANMKALGDYIQLQNNPEPFTTLDALLKLKSAKNNPLGFSVERGAALDFCKAKMLKDGYSIESIFNPELLVDVKKKYAEDVFELVRTGNAKELMGIMEYGCSEFSAKINEMLDQMPSLDDNVISDPKYKNLIGLGLAFKDLHQEFKNIPDEFKTETDKKLIYDLSLSVDSLGRFTHSIGNYVGCANKCLNGDEQLCGQLNTAFINDIAQHKCVNSIFKEMKSSKDYDHVIIHSLVNTDGSEKQALRDLIKVNLYCVLEFDDDDLLDCLKTSSEIKSFGEKLYSGSIGFDVVIDKTTANGIRLINGDKLERAVQQSLTSGQKALS